MKEKMDTEVELTALKNTTLEQIWTTELSTLRGHYSVYKQKREKIQMGKRKENQTKKNIKALKLKK